MMLDAVAGVTQAGADGHCVANGEWIEELLKKIIRADFDVIVEK